MENWNEVDPLCSGFIQLDEENGEVSSLFPEIWVAVVLAPQLDDAVPQNIRELFEVARAVMLYGYFFYPFFGLSMEQFYRVGESAISLKYEICGGPSKTPNGRFVSFSARINWLANMKFIDIKQKHEWHWVREARNDGSHMLKPKLYPPFPSTMALEETADRINQLFAS